MSARSRGFTMIESLIALAVLSIGLLGAAVMLLESLGTQGAALRMATATQLLRDAIERSRARLAACADPACDRSPSAEDRAALQSAARAFVPGAVEDIEFAPATGLAALDRFVFTLRWREPRGGDDIVVTMQMLASPVAG